MTKVLLFRPNAAVAGGVVNYYSVILRKFSADIEIEEFLVGRRRGLLGSKALYPLRFVLDCLRLIVVLLSRRHDVYHFNPSLNSSSYVRDAILIGLLSLFPQKKIVIFFRGWEEEYFEKLMLRSWKRKIFLWFLSQATKILVLASSFQEDLEKIGVSPDKIAVTSTTFDGSLLKTAKREKSDERVTFIFMSRLIKKKGVFELVDAARILEAEDYQFRLVIAGSGPDEEALREIVRQNNLEDLIYMSGYLRGADKARALVSADVFVLPTSHGEGCPNCILEAMGSGLPIITTKVGGIPDIVKDPENGILLDNVTAQEIAAAMGKFVDDAGLRAAVSECNKRQAWERYESSNVAKYLESVYRQVAIQ